MIRRFERWEAGCCHRATSSVESAVACFKTFETCFLNWTTTSPSITLTLPHTYKHLQATHQQERPKIMADEGAPTQSSDSMQNSYDETSRAQNATEGAANGAASTFNNIKDSVMSCKVSVMA